MNKDQLRERFAKSLSKMYEAEVSEYHKLKELVLAVNQNHSSDEENSINQNYSDYDGHGAIRLADASELSFLKRLFACFNLLPVDYYDLTQSGIPVHSTAFRPIELESIHCNSFRIFCSLLRIDLINPSIQKKVKQTLKKRNFISNHLLLLIEKVEQECELKDDEINQLIEGSVNLFRFNNEALVDEKTYQTLLQSHPIIADVVSFANPHINHLTIPTLDIDEVQMQMQIQMKEKGIETGIQAKAIIEGAPKRKCPILLRQTAFIALSEEVWFQSQNKNLNKGAHTARFGEIEQRGCALTKKGRNLYDNLLNQVQQQITPKADGSNQSEYQSILNQTFKSFPDDWNQMREQDLAYFSYHRTDKKADWGTDFKTTPMDTLIALGLVSFKPIIYQDFLPISAAGIFRSNLGNEEKNSYQQMPNQILFEQSLEAKVHSQFNTYEKIQSQSIEKIRQIQMRDY